MGPLAALAQTIENLEDLWAAGRGTLRAEQVRRQREAEPTATFDNVSVVAQADRSGAFDQAGAVTDGTAFAGGLDGLGNAYSATLPGAAMSDWLDPQGYGGEAVAAALGYSNSRDGSSPAVTNYLYQYRFALNSQKTVSSVTLPGNGNVLILAIDLSV